MSSQVTSKCLCIDQRDRDRDTDTNLEINIGIARNTSVEVVFIHTYMHARTDIQTYCLTACFDVQECSEAHFRTHEFALDFCSSQLQSLCDPVQLHRIEACLCLFPGSCLLRQILCINDV